MGGRRSARVYRLLKSRYLSGGHMGLDKVRGHFMEVPIPKSPKNRVLGPKYYDIVMVLGP